MSISLQSACLIGVDAHLIEVEYDHRPGLTKYHIVGLPDKACLEAKERIKSALRSCNIKLPQAQVVFNLAPANIPKTGSGFDLAMALGIIAKQKDISQAELNRTIFLGELALDGSLRSVDGAIATAQLAKEKGISSIIVPQQNAKEASLISGVSVYGATHLQQVINHLSGGQILQQAQKEKTEREIVCSHDLAYIKGQKMAKRVLEIAAAGNHNVLFEGPPGSGKTMLAKSLLSLLPKVTENEYIEILKIYSAAGVKQTPYARPFRSPHHSASLHSLVGGGQVPKPGEVTLAHHGVLFLDELPEFPRGVLEALRQPLEDKRVSITRVRQSLSFPADLLCIAAMNPCPCGYATDKQVYCSCSKQAQLRYKQKLSGPLLDRFDLFVHIPRLTFSELQEKTQEESSSSVRKRIEQARSLQLSRFSTTHVTTNNHLSSHYLQALDFSKKCKSLLEKACTHFSLSTRAYYRVLRVARTIADLEGQEVIDVQHIAEALQYRRKSSSL